MSEGTTIALFNLKAVSTLINRVSDATGILYEPTRIRRKAKAEAEAKIIATQADIEATDLERRALVRFVGEETKKQENIESVLDQAIPQIKDSAKPEDTDKDWLANFFEKIKTISDEEVQQHWAKLLAEEANQPGRFSKRTVNALHSLDRKDAEMFQNLMRFAWVFDDPDPIVLDLNADIYKMNEVKFFRLQHLDTLGLIHFDNVGTYGRRNLKGKRVAHYYEKSLPFDFGDEGNAEFKTGHVMLTQIGREMAQLINVPPVEGFFEYVADHWSQWVVKTD